MLWDAVADASTAVELDAVAVKAVVLVPMVSVGVVVVANKQVDVVPAEEWKPNQLVAAVAATIPKERSVQDCPV